MLLAPVNQASKSDDDSLPGDAVRGQLETVLSSPQFVASERIKRFLRFVVEEALAGRSERLKEYTIALEVFGRDESFDPQTSSIVRVEAGRLRRQLNHYYLTDGKDDPIHIEIPRGSYVPQFRLKKSGTPDREVKEKQKTPPPAASIAVLPFDNLTGDVQQESFTDGITEELITALARVKDLSVVARNTTFQYKHQAVDVRALGRELAVRYVVEGSVRGARDATRVTLQLLDAVSGVHVWAQRFDYDMNARSALEVQDDVTGATVSEISARLGVGDESAMGAGSETKAVTPERRQLTVMFCDLADSTARATALDPEDAFEVMKAYQQTYREVVQGFGGYIGRFVSYGVWVYFGYPHAHEDDAERALRAGLALVDRLSALETKNAQGLDIRIGIATGQVVAGHIVGEGVMEKETVAGPTLNLAARLQTVAGTNAVVIGPRTRRLVGGRFVFEDLGEHTFEGFSTPVPAWRVSGLAQHESRFEAMHASALAPLVGRKSELGLLIERWQQASTGEGQVVLLCGEPGIGKSRLAQELSAHVATFPHTRLRYQCSPYHMHTALHPVIKQLVHALGLVPEDTAEAKLDKLEALLSRSSEQPADAMALFAALLGIDTAGRYAPLEASAERQKELTFAALAQQLAGLAGIQPVLVLFEDMHWADPSTLELMERMVEQMEGLPVLGVVTHRPEFSSPWGQNPHVTPLMLNRLGSHDGAAMVERVTGGKALPAEVFDQIVEKTDGVPLFIEELTGSVLESGLLEEEEDGYRLTGPLPPLAIPATLQDSLTARLDRLAPVKEVAQIGALIGREFSYALLAAVSPLNGLDLQTGLEQLVKAGLLFRRARPPQATYTFKHALVQDAACEGMLRSRRSQWHASIAKALEERFPDTAPEVLARHFTAAGLNESALSYWDKAGQQAARQSANAEAAQHFGKAIELLGALSVTPETMRKEVELQIALGGVCLTTKGFSGRETQRAFNRANELCNQLGDTALVMPALYGIADAYFVSGQLETAHEVSHKYFALAEQSEETGDLVRAHDLEGFILLFMGDVMEACGHLKQCVTLYDREQHRELKFQYGYDPAVDAMGFLSLSLWLLGYPDQALHRSQEATHLGREIVHAPSLVNAQFFALAVHGWRREPETVQGLAKEMIETCSQCGFRFWQTQATIMHGWALSQSGGGHEGVRELRRGIADRRASGAKVGLSYFLALLVEATAATGDTQEALSVLDEAFAVAESNGERFHEPELYRLKSELLLAQGATKAEVEGLYKQALALARERSMKSLELRAAMSLARLWRTQRKKKKARELLADVYGWFTEGFETADLKEAKQLLDELS